MSIKLLLQKDPMFTFSVIKLAFQSHAEIDPTVLEKFDNNVRDPWTIINEDGGVHPMIFDVNVFNPTLSYGWTQLQKYNKFPDNVEVVFGYYGNNLFGVVMFREVGCCTEIPSFHSRREVGCCTEIPSFHSRSLKGDETKTFDIKLTYNDFTSEIVILPHDFGTFVRQNLLHTIRLCCDDGKNHLFHFFLRNDSNFTTTLGLKWKDFCKTNYYQPGQTIRFKFCISNTKMCHVFPVAVLY